MANKYGILGSIKIDGQEIAHMTDWNLDQSADIKEASFFKGTGKEKTVGLTDWTASCSGRVDFATTSGQKEVFDAFQAGDLVELVLYLNDTTYFTGECYIDSIAIDNSAEGEYNIDISVSGNGGIQATIPTSGGVDFSALNALILIADQEIEDDYTEATWEPFEVALATAKTVANNTNATQSEVNAAFTTLDTTHKALELKT